jgi:hypothetical protein
MMQKYLLLMGGFLFLYVAVFSQDGWELSKDEDGIRIYTRQRENSRLLSYRIETEVAGSLDAVYQQVIDFQENKKYLERIDSLVVLEKDRDNEILVYMLFKVPWPFRDRDFVNRMLINMRGDTITMESSPAPGKMPPRDGVLRIKEFSEQWVLAGKADNRTILSLQGHADPGGSLPDWVINLFVVNEPHALVRGIKREVETTQGER